MIINFWKKAILAGLIAATVMLLLEFILNPLIEISSWGPLQMRSAILLGEEVLPSSASFDFTIIFTGLLVHYTLSIVYAIILSAIICKSNDWAALGIGALFGLSLYLINFYVFTDIFPWFVNIRNWVQISIHILFGLSAALTYVRVKSIYKSSHQTIH